MASIATAATAMLTLLLVLFAWRAWMTAKESLKAAEKTSKAAAKSANQAAELTKQAKMDAIEQAEQARSTLSALTMAAEATQKSAEASEGMHSQARADSITRTRPYVYVVIVPGLHGPGDWDVKITNTGQSAAKNLTLDYDQWPDEQDDVAESVQGLFHTARTLPPGVSIRAVWRLTGTFTNGTNDAGLGTSGQISVSYDSDGEHAHYLDSFDVMIDQSGLWPVPGAGPEPTGLTGDYGKFYQLGRTITRHIGEINR